MHQQIRSQVKTVRSQANSEARGTLEELLDSVKAFDLTVAAFSATEPDVFVIAVDDEEDPDAGQKCLEAIDRTRFKPELVDLAEGRDWKKLQHVSGSLLETLRSMDALDAVEVLIGCTMGGDFFVQVRR